MNNTTDYGEHLENLGGQSCDNEFFELIEHDDGFSYHLEGKFEDAGGDVKNHDDFCEWIGELTEDEQLDLIRSYNA